MNKKIAVIAIGGNSLVKDKAHQSIQDQYKAVNDTCKHIAEMIQKGWTVAIGHGNGPAVGSHFAEGSMAPKIQACIKFIENGGKKAIITDPDNIGRALVGDTGTCIEL